MEPVIAVKDLRKVFKPKSKGHKLEVKAIDGISFEIARGEFFGRAANALLELADVDLAGLEIDAARLEHAPAFARQLGAQQP